MKKIKWATLALTAFLSSSLAFAGTNSLSDYYSTMHPKASVAGGKNLLHPNTDISVINATSSYIYVVVPGAINDYLNPGYNDHIYSPNGYDTYLVLQDPYRNTFLAANVCRLAIVTAYGYPGNYRWNIDDDLCH